MIIPIDDANASKHTDLLDEMFRNRAETFKQRLNWRVEVENGRERDRFDDCNPLYLVSVDAATGEYQGSLRLLPTTGPNMLRDVFPFLLDGLPMVESSTIWESSRICARYLIGAEAAPAAGRQALGELLAGIAEVSMPRGLTRIVSVFDARIYKLLRGVGCRIEIIGRPQRIEGTMSYVGLFDTGGGELERARDQFGFEGSILAPQRGGFELT